MTIVVRDKSRIHFQFEGERGAFLILHHGLFGSHRDWFEAGYVEALAKDFRLIIPDARGHGRSDRPTDSAAYSLAGMADDLVAVLDWLDIRNAHFVGYSLGALVGFDMLRRHPERVRMLMIGGEAPFPTEGGRTLWREDLSGIQQGSFASWVESEKDAGRLVRHDPVNGEDEQDEQDAAIPMLAAMAAWELPEQDSLPVRSPITLFSGADDGAAGRIEEASKRIPRAHFLAFPGIGHSALFDGKDALLEAINNLLRTTTPGEDRPGSKRQDSQRGSGRGNLPNNQRGGGPRGKEQGEGVPSPEQSSSETQAATAGPGVDAEPKSDGEKAKTDQASTAEAKREGSRSDPENVEPSTGESQSAGEVASDSPPPGQSTTEAEVTEKTAENGDPADDAGKTGEKGLDD